MRQVSFTPLMNLMLRLTRNASFRWLPNAVNDNVLGSYLPLEDASSIKCAFVLINQCSVQVYGRESVKCELRLVIRHVIDCKVACKKLNCVAEDLNISGIVSAENSGCRAH